MARTFQDTQGSTIDQDIRAALDFKPVTRKEINQAYRPYRDKFGRIKDSMTDEQLYQRAVTRVISWWKRQEAKSRKATGKAPGDGRHTPSMSGGGRAGGNPFAGSSGGSSGGAGGSSLPDTAMGGDANVKPLKPIRDPRDSASNPDDMRREQRRLQAARPLSDFQARTVLKRMDVKRSAWQHIPPYAFRSKKALRNYIIRKHLKGTAASPVIGRAPRPVASDSESRVGTNLREF